MSSNQHRILNFYFYLIKLLNAILFFFISLIVLYPVNLNTYQRIHLVDIIWLKMLAGGQEILLKRKLIFNKMHHNWYQLKIYIRIVKCVVYCFK